MPLGQLRLNTVSTNGLSLIHYMSEMGDVACPVPEI
jgi:hypothetical protein